MGSGGLYSPGPATAVEHRLSTMWRPLNDVLTPSWVSAGPSPSLGDGRLSSHPFARHLHRRSRADDRASLGPRSLLPPLFLERCVRAYSRPGCCLPTSATNHDVRTLSTGLSFPRRDDGHDHLPFLTPHARPLPKKSGEARRAAHSSVDLDPVPVPPTLVGLPDRDIRAAAPPRPAFAEGVTVTIDVHGSLDRVKDVSSFEAALVGRHLDECGRLAHADHVPLLILPEDTCCRRCVCLPGNEPPAGVTDRPRRALFRRPAKADGILRIRVPFTVTSRGA